MKCNALYAVNYVHVLNITSEDLAEICVGYAAQDGEAGNPDSRVRNAKRFNACLGKSTALP